MRHQKPLPKESSFNEFSDNRKNGEHKPHSNGAKRNFTKSGARNEPRGGNFKRNDSGSKEMFDAICMKCKKPCKVPFKPINGKGVSCSDCFVKKDGGRGSFGGRDSRGNSFSGNRGSFKRNDSGSTEMFDAICMKCKKPCKVPFKPTTGRGVSCSDCFVRKEPSRGGNFGGRDSRGRNDSRGSNFSGGGRRNDSRGGGSFGGRDKRSSGGRR